MLATPARAAETPSLALAGRAAALRCLVETCDTTSGRSGPLAGLTYVAKDLLDVAGRKPGCGLGQSAAEPPLKDAALLIVLDAAGAARRGYAEMTPLAFEPSGGNAARGRPLNPWNPARICGGSSSGSAVAVAAGLTDFSIGSDTAGSLRIPAQCCGVTAWKPTPGLVPLDGAMALSPSLDVVGFLAREASTLERIAVLFCRDQAPRRIATIAVANDLIAQSEPAIARAIESLAARLKASGRRLAPEPLAALLKACDVPVLDVLQAESAAEHGWRLANGTLEPTLAARLRKGLAIPPEQADEARARLKAIAGALSLFRQHGAILLPVMPIVTPEVAACEPGSVAFSARTLYALSAYTRFVNGLGLAAVALPCGFDENGMPIAAQLVGPAGSDLALLALAADIQRDSDWHALEPTGVSALLKASR
jgi:Asp-tRNA(Asn)/Glu-tRNA(Gln) amidotransferase A subunit family amidase